MQGDASDATDSTAKEGPYWSLMFEISESKLKPVKQSPIKLAGGKWPEIVKETIIGALNTKMVDAKDEIVSIYHRLLTLLFYDHEPDYAVMSCENLHVAPCRRS